MLVWHMWYFFGCTKPNQLWFLWFQQIADPNFSGARLFPFNTPHSTFAWALDTSTFHKSPLFPSRHFSQVEEQKIGKRVHLLIRLRWGGSQLMGKKNCRNNDFYDISNKMEASDFKVFWGHFNGGTLSIHSINKF